MWSVTEDNQKRHRDAKRQCDLTWKDATWTLNITHFNRCALSGELSVIMNTVNGSECKFI